ncbi:MAG: BREX-2 system phosphatase PglZ [Acidimicrobiales bacterium]
MATADAAQVRALAAAYVPDAADHQRALALRADADWTGPDMLNGAGRTMRVVACRSPLAVREALLDHLAAPELLVVLTPCSGADLGLDVRTRLVKGDVLPLDPFRSVLALFRASVLDPRLVAERWLIDDLIALAPPGGWAGGPVGGGVLDTGRAWRTWHRARLGIDDEPADLGAVLALAEQPEVAAAIAHLPADRRARLAARWGEGNGPAVPVLVDLIAAGRGPDLAAFGLVAEVLWAAPDRSGVADVQVVARVRMETVFGRDRLSPEAAEAWGDAAVAWLDQPARAGDVLDTAERELAGVGASELAVLSHALASGFDLRLRALGRALSSVDLDSAVTAVEWVRRHRLAARRGHRIEAAEAAVRLLRRLGRSRAESPSTFAAAAEAYARDGAYADQAARLVEDGDQVPELAEAYARLASDTAATRAREVRDFTGLLAEWSASEPAPDARIVPLEWALEQVVTPVAREAPVLLVVCDGMGLPVAQELLADLEAEGWAAAAPEGGAGWPVGVALLPTVTEASRTALLTGTRRHGGQAEERAGFAGHAALVAASSPAHPPVLFHKAALVGPSGTALPDNVSQAVADPDQRVIGVVVNSVDDHLARGDQIRVGWDLAALRPLGWLLDAAGEAGRVVIVTADHGHVIHRPDAIARPSPGGGERWRTPPPAARDDEVEVAGPRVLLGGGRVVLPADARLRYGGYKHGYHGGATPEEVLVPVAVLARTLPAGWRHHPVARPDWWTGEARAPVPRPLVAPPPVPTTARPRLPQPSLFERPVVAVVPIAGGSGLVDALLASEAFVANRARVRLPRPLPDERLRAYLAPVEANGGVLALRALSERTGEPPDTLRMALTLVQRLVNLDGAEVLAVRADGTIELNRELAAFQFDLRTP